MLALRMGYYGQSVVPLILKVQFVVRSLRKRASFMLPACPGCQSEVQALPLPPS